MGGNPKDSKWHSTTRDMRRRKPLAVTLSPESLVRLELLSARWQCSKSQALDRVLRETDVSMVGQ